MTSVQAVVKHFVLFVYHMWPRFKSLLQLLNTCSSVYLIIIKTKSTVLLIIVWLFHDSVLVLDKVDQFEICQQGVQTIFEWPALQGPRRVLIAIANRLDLTESVLPRLPSSMCTSDRLHFSFFHTPKQQIACLSAITHKLEQVCTPQSTLHLLSVLIFIYLF